MNIAEDFEVSTVLEGPAQCTSVLQILEGDCSVPSEPKVEEHEILSDDRSSWTTEVEGEGIFNRTEVMEFENKVLWEETFRTPDDPTHADLRKTKFVCSGMLSIYPGGLNIIKTYAPRC